LSVSDLQPPRQGEWVEYEDDRRRLLLHGGPVIDPLRTLAEAGWERFELVSTSRALADASGLADGAERTRLVPAGRVDEISAPLVDEISSDRLVALGGGRVIDTAKAIASVTGAEVAAIPTTLSGAPVTGFHRLPAGREAEVSGFARPALVVAYAEAMTSAPEPQLRATAMNALAHGAESLYVPNADAASREAALRGAELLAGALDQSPQARERSALALGAILCGIATDSAAGIALHHVLGQTAVRVLEVPHAEAYAALLPETMRAMRERAPERIGALAAALGTDPAGLPDRIADLAGHRGLGELGADRDRLEEVVEGALARRELSLQTPGEVGRDDLAAILDAAWWAQGSSRL
jgi:alcohol dehydrogenase class IV